MQKIRKLKDGDPKFKKDVDQFEVVNVTEKKTSIVYTLERIERELKAHQNLKATYMKRFDNKINKLEAMRDEMSGFSSQKKEGK